MKSIIAALALVVVVAPAGARAAIPSSEAAPFAADVSSDVGDGICTLTGYYDGRLQRMVSFEEAQESVAMADVPADAGDGMCTLTGYYDGRLERMVSYEEAVESVATASAPSADAQPVLSARLDEEAVCTDIGYFDGEQLASLNSYHQYAPRPTLASAIPELAAFLATTPEEALAGDAALLTAATPSEPPVVLSLVPAELAGMVGDPVTPPLLPTFAVADASTGSDMPGTGGQSPPEAALYASAEARSCSLTRPTCSAQLASNVFDAVSEAERIS